MNQPPKFITFEGTEGVGKTTAIDRFCHKLNSLSIAHIRTREPGGSPLAEDLRKILLDNKTHINDDTELLLMFAARADHLHRTILPALSDGKWVICDRFFDSTVAYQGFGRFGGDERELAKIERLIADFIPRQPDLTFWLDLDPAIGLERAGKRSQADRFESAGQGFFDKAYQGFLYQYQKHPERIKRINADQRPDGVAGEIMQVLQEYLAD
ncbi:dTMP kinase [Moraxella equi]|uniref:Thymidylate kinase n=1 Tax=Moraxella equi TaxID=60442 RepID=A0A378QT01_9GAMM|nr:dTMP kinase [Moraxella equi]OPH39775.1 dTMP kinase [Moraxella equi]STZ03995.1 Thymidylate kinase [Moraxella equi]